MIGSKLPVVWVEGLEARTVEVVSPAHPLFLLSKVDGRERQRMV